jgi:glycerol-3-phosphate dehydrogenase
MYDVVIIGAGITGCAAAFELSRYRLSVAVLERENDVGAGVTKANTGIIHAGYDPEPGTVMARANIEGRRLAGTLCEQLDVPHRECGSLVLSFNPENDETLRRLYRRGLANGAEGLSLLSAAETLALEPNLNPAVRGSLRAAGVMVLSPWEYALAFMETAVKNGAELFLEAEVRTIQRSASGWRLETAAGIFEGRFVINAAGLQGDTIHNMAAPPAFTIKPGRGEYYLLDKSEGAAVGHVIFQCPSSEGKGVTVTPTVHGNLLAGPNFEIPPEREDVSTTAAGLAEVAEKARLSVPSLNFAACVRTFSGIRAGSGVDDFIVGEAAPGFFDAAGIKSPGLSSAPALAKMLAGLLAEKGLPLQPRVSFISRRSRVRFAALGPGEQAALIRQDGAYGRVICRCETVTEGEIRDALAAPIPPRSVDAVKRRCNPGLGRCQGGFCGPRVVEILARHYGIDETAVLQDRSGSLILEDFPQRSRL